MVLKASVAAIFVLILSILAPYQTNAADIREEIIDNLKETELPSVPMDELTDKQLSEIALLSKTLEAKRDTYARAIELYIERIGAGKDVDQALIDYERAEISLAAEWKETRKVLEIIKKQDKLAHDWKKHRSLHPPEHHTANEHHGGGYPGEHHADSQVEHYEGVPPREHQGEHMIEEGERQTERSKLD